jgi:glycosyltransferase involved in cell wall biosynthesis
LLGTRHHVPKRRKDAKTHLEPLNGCSPTSSRWRIKTRFVASSSPKKHPSEYADNLSAAQRQAVFASSSRLLMRICLLHNYRERAQVSMMLYADRLGEALSERGISVTRVRPSDVLPRTLTRYGWARKADAYLGRFAKYPWIAGTLGADLFHVIDHSHAHLIDALPVGRTVVTCHDLILLALASGKLRADSRTLVAPYVLRFSVRRLHRAAAVIATSSNTKKDVIELLGVAADRIHVVYPGLNFDFRYQPEARVAARSKWGLGNDRLVLHVGATTFYKNIETVLKVVALLRRRGLAVNLVRAGQRLSADHLALARRLGVDHAVHDLGPMIDSDLRDLYNAADVLLFPSLYEGFGWPPIEAMASGLPVVASRCGSLDEVLGDAALTADPQDVDALAEAVERVFDDERLAGDLRERGFNNARRFQWSKAAADVSAVYDRLVARS